MANNITVKDALGVNQTVQTVFDGGVHTPVHRPLGYDAVGDKLLVGTSRDRFFDNFASFDTSASGNWEVVQTGAGMTISGPSGGNAAGASPYINIASGTTTGKTIILSRSSFTMPVDLRYQITASQRIANNRFIIGFVQVDSSGAIVTDTAITTAPELLDARNAVAHRHDGTTATTAQLVVRGAGAAIDPLANAFGTGFTTVATGTGPNFITATTYGLMVERDRISSRAYGQNLLTNTGGQFAFDRVMINPTVRYKLCMIVENTAAPASSTDWRVHVVNVLDATRFDVSPRNAGTTDRAKAMPVVGNVVIDSGTVTTVTTVTTCSTVTTAGTPTAPATPFILNSAATTNGSLILTGTSGLHAFHATNTGASVAFVKLYNKATAPTVGTDVPAMVIPLPAAPASSASFVNLNTGHNAFRFALGLGIAITGGVADTDTTAVAAGQVKVMLSRTV